MLRMDTSVDEATRQSLLDWCRTVTLGYPGVFIRDFTESWRDGRAFLALIHRYKPGLIDFHRVDAQTAKQNIEWVFSLAERELQVIRLFDSEDVSAFSDEKSMMTYIASLYEALAADNPAVPPMPSLYGETVSSTTKNLVGAANEASKHLQCSWSEYRALAADLVQWLRSTTDRMASRHFPPDLESMQHRVLNELKQHLREERPRRERDRQQLVRMFEELKADKQNIPHWSQPDPSQQIGSACQYADEFINPLLNELFVTVFVFLFVFTCQSMEHFAIESVVLGSLDHRALKQGVGLYPSANRDTLRACMRLPALHSGQLPSDPFLSIDQIHRLWGEYDVVLQEREMAARSETRRLDRLQWAGDRVVRECRAVDGQLTGLERHLQDTSSGLNASRLFGAQLDRWTEQLGVVETRVNGLFNQVQHLRSGRYTQTDQIYRDVCTLHQRLLDLQRRFRNRVQTNGFHSSINPITTISSSVVGCDAPPGSSRLGPNQTDRRYEFLTPIQRCMRWIDEHSVTVEQASYGTNRKITQTTPTHLLLPPDPYPPVPIYLFPYQVAHLPHDAQVFEESMRALDEAYNRLMDASSHRSELAKKLLEFVRRAEQELTWLREQESREVNRDWSKSDQLNADEIRTCAQNLMEQLRDREIVYSELNSVGSSIQLENQSAGELVQAYLTALDRHWSWFLQLMGCLEVRLEQIKRTREFYANASRYEAALNANLGLLCTEFGPSQQSRSLDEGEQFTKKLQTIVAQITELESQVNVVVQNSQEILPSLLDTTSSLTAIGSSRGWDSTKDKSEDHPFVGLPVRAICCFRSSDYWIDNQSTAEFGSVTSPVMGYTYWPAGEEPSSFEKGDRLIVVHTADTKVWKLRTPSGTCLTVPITCFLPSWSCIRATERAKQLLTLLGRTKSFCSIVELRLRGQMLMVAMDDWHQSLQHFSRKDAMQTATLNGPDRSSTSDVSEDQHERVMAVVEKLRGVFNTLATRLQNSSTKALPGCLSELESRILEHKDWTQDLARAQTQCLELDQYITSKADVLPSATFSVHTQSLRSASSQLQTAGRGRTHLLANTDAWLVHLDEADQALCQCENRLLTSAVHNHGLMHVDGPLEPANQDGLRSAAVDRAHEDLKVVAERLLSLRNELDALYQRLDSLPVVGSENLTRSEPNENVLADASLLQLLLPADTRALELNLAVSHRRLGAATKQVESELKSFGDALRQFTSYRIMREQTTGRLDELNKRAIAISELARSVGLDHGPDTNLIKAALLQAEETLTDTESCLEQLEALNHNVAELVFILVSYAQSTQSYRQLVESTFQKGGASRDYRWSPGFGLFDLCQILRKVDRLNLDYNEQSQFIYDQVQSLYKVIENSGYSGPLTLSTAPQVVDYLHLYPGEWPSEILVPKSTSACTSDLVPEHLALSQTNGASKFGPIIPGSFRTVGQWELHLDGTATEPVVVFPLTADQPQFQSSKLPFHAHQHRLSQLVQHPISSSGAWFVTRLADTQGSVAFGEPMCLGDALRCGLLNPQNGTCQQSSIDPSMEISWSAAVQQGWLTGLAVQVLNSPVELTPGLSQTVSQCLIPTEQNRTFVDSNTGELVPGHKRLVELLKEKKISSSDFFRLAYVLTSGICVEYRDTWVRWYEAKSSTNNPVHLECPRPCLSDWLSAGAYNPVSGRLRVSVLESQQQGTGRDSFPDRRVFSEHELTIREAVNLGLVDPSVPEVVVPMDSSDSLTNTPYRRITLSMSVSLGLLDDVKGLWCGISQVSKTTVSLHVAQAAGLIARAPDLANALLSGLFVSGHLSNETSSNCDFVDPNTGSHLTLTEAVQRGLMIGDRRALIVKRRDGWIPLTVNEAIRSSVLNETGRFVLPDGHEMSLWDAVNAGFVRLIQTDCRPAPVGIIHFGNAQQKHSPHYYQHPVLQALRTGLLDSASEQIILSEAEAQRHGLSVDQRRVPLRKAPKLGNLCDSHTVHLLTRPCGLSYPDGRDLSGLEALARGWLQPSSELRGTSSSATPTTPGTHGLIVDPVSGSSLNVNHRTQWTSSAPINCTGAQLLLGLSSNRPDRGYLVTEREISRLAFLGPGLHDDYSTIEKGDRFGHISRSEYIEAVVDPITGRRITLAEAIKRCLLDMETGTFRNPTTGHCYSISEAVHNGLIHVRTNSSPPSGENGVPEFSLKDTRTFRIFGVIDPVTKKTLTPDQAIADGLLNMKTMQYTGCHSSISIDEARQRELILVHESADSALPNGTKSIGSARSSLVGPLSLNELIMAGRLVEQPDGQCMIKTSDAHVNLSITNAISMGHLDAERSLIRNAATGKWSTLTEALASGQVDCHTGYVDLQPGWISLLDAVSRGLLSDEPTTLHGRMSFQEALTQGYIDPATSTFYKPESSRSSTPKLVSVQEAIRQGWLEPPKTGENNLSDSVHSVRSRGQKRTASPSPVVPKKRGTLGSSLRSFVLRAHSPVKSHTTPVPRTAQAFDGSTTSDQTFSTGGRTETKTVRVLTLGHDSSSSGRFWTKSRPAPWRRATNPITDGRSMTTAQSTQKVPVEVRLCERNCVLYAFYYLHDEVRVEAAITESMLREGRVDVRRGLVCDPTSGLLVPVNEALTEGFVFGIVFTRAERVSLSDPQSNMSESHQNKKTIYWLEVFHYRHDIYQIERVYDPYLKRLVPLKEALDTGIVDPIHCTYTHPVSGDLYSIEDALYRGWIQALPIGTPPPFDLIGSSFDNIHVRTVEEGYTFTSFTRPVIPRVPVTLTATPTKISKAMETEPEIDELVRTTMSVKRLLPGRPVPEYHPGPRSDEKSHTSYHLKSGYQLRPDGMVENVHTGTRMSVDEAIKHNYAREKPEEKYLIDHLTVQSFNRETRPLDPESLIPIVGGGHIPATCLSLVRYQRAAELPSIRPVTQKTQWMPRYLTLETAIKRGWIDPNTGRLHTQNGRTSRMNLLDAVEQGLIDPMEILVRIVNPLEADLSEPATYADHPVTVYYSLATVLSTANVIAQAMGHQVRVNLWNKRLLQEILTAASLSLQNTPNSTRLAVRVQPTLTETHYAKLDEIIATSSHLNNNLTSSTETSVGSTRSVKETKVVTTQQALESLALYQQTAMITFISSGQQLDIEQAIQQQIVSPTTPLIMGTTEGHGVQFLRSTSKNIVLKIKNLDQLHCEPTEIRQNTEKSEISNQLSSPTRNTESLDLLSEVSAVVSDRDEALASLDVSSSLLSDSGVSDKTVAVPCTAGLGLISGDQSMVLDPRTGRLESLGKMLLMGTLGPGVLIAQAVQSLRDSKRSADLVPSDVDVHGVVCDVSVGGLGQGLVEESMIESGVSDRDVPVAESSVGDEFGDVLSSPILDVVSGVAVSEVSALVSDRDEALASLDVSSSLLSDSGVSDKTVTVPCTAGLGDTELSTGDKISGEVVPIGDDLRIADAEVSDSGVGAGAREEEFGDSVARDGVSVAVAPSGLLLSEALEAGLVDPTSGMVRVPGTADETVSLSDAVDSGLISGDQSMVLDPRTGRLIDLRCVDLLDRARQRQSEVRAVLFQIEQFLQSHQNTVSAAQRDPLNTDAMEIRERLDRIQREAEFRVRTLISSLDELEHLTDKLQTVRKLLDRCDKGVIKSLTDRSYSSLLLTSYDDLTQLVPRLHTILAQTQAAQLEVNNLPQLGRTFLASVNRYNTSKSAFRASLNRPSRDQVQPTEDNRDLERTVLTAVHEANERLCALTNSVQGRIRSIQEASDQYQLFSDELARLRSGLDHIEAEYQKSLSCSDPLENFGDQLSTAQRRKVQMQLDALFASAAELNTLGCALRNLQHHSVESLYDHLVQAGLSADVTSEIVRRPIDVELERRTNLHDLIHQRIRKLAQLLADKQTVTDTLTASMRWADKIERELSNLDLTPADDADHRLSLTHRVQAELEAHQAALEAARLRVDGVVNDAKSEPSSVSEADMTTAQAFTKQINQLEQRLNTIQGRVHTNLDSLTGSIEVLDQGRRQVDDLNTWITQTFDSLDQAQLSRLRDSQLSDKLVEIKKEIFSRRKKLEDLQDLVSRLPSSSPIPMNQELQSMVDAVEKRSIELENVLHTREKDLEQRKSQHKPFTEALERVSDWLDNFEGRSNSLPTIAVSTRLVQQQLAELEPLLGEWHAHESDITGVEKLGAAYDRLRDQLGTEGAVSEVAHEVVDLRERYTHLGSKLTDRKTELEATAQDLQALEQNYQGLIEWLDKRLQPLVGQNERLTSLQALSEASAEAQRIHDEISGGMSSLDDFREQASAVLRSRDYANGASELRATVTNIERHWAVAVNVATERHNSLELLLKDITEFKRLHARLLQELKQKSLLISHAAQSTDQLSPDRIRAESERLRQLQTALDNLTPEIERLDSSGHRLLGRLPETIATDLQIPQTVREIRTEHEQLRAPISALIDKLSACLGPRVQFEELLERANVFLSPLQPILSSTDIDRARLAVARDRLEQARELLAEASQLGDRLVAATDDPTEQFDLKTKLLKVLQLLDKTDVTISMKSSGKSEIDLPGYTKMAELCEWMSEKSKQIQEVDEAIRQQTHGLYPLQSAVLVDRIEAMQAIVEEIKQKSDDLKHLQKPDVPHGCKPVIIDPIKTAMEQLRLLQRAVQDKRSKLQDAVDHPITAHTRLNQLEAWIADRNRELSEPVVPTSGTYLFDPGRFTVIEDRMNSIMSEVEAQLIALSQLKLDDSDLGNERLRAQRVEAFTHRTESLRNQLQHVHDAAQNRMLQIQKVNQHLTAAQDVIQEYRAAADEAETRWISVQQDLCKSGAHPASHISSSIPSQEEFHRLQMDLFNLLDESVPVESVDEAPVSLRMIISVQNLEYSLKAVGDGDPRRSVGGLLADVANTRKRLEAIVNSLNSDLGTATETAESNQTVALIKQLNAVSRQLRNADEVLSAYPTASPGLDPQTLRERARNLSETTQSLTDCKESLDKLRAQLQPTVTPSRTSMPSSDWLVKLDKLEKETMNLVNQAYNANENISTRLAQSEQLAQLRENLSQSVRRARDACLSPPQSPSPIPDGAEAIMTDPEDLVHKITEDLRVLSNLSRHLSASSADDTVQRHLELELKAAGDAVEELHSNLRMTTGRQRNLSAARLDQVEKGIKRLRTILEEIAEDWRAQSELTVKSGEDQARQRDNYRLMYARTMTHANSVEQLDALLRLVSGSPESSAAVSDDMRTEVAQLREAYHELAEHIQTHLSRSTDAEQAQQALQDRIQIAVTWYTENPNANGGTSLTG
ncbi:hypothetical protein FGIG_01848 [Fasciola gigantica]|uniref:Calponin-homology (CH) domain-containing protein n=1 Tax=Fasciola gigantica TaxID=46835 RepID=A0A504YLU9_FASGI|nr:hypothetical protein FGIG_01848 [Fasciola gigantica]